MLSTLRGLHLYCYPEYSQDTCCNLNRSPLLQGPKLEAGCGTSQRTASLHLKACGKFRFNYGWLQKPLWSNTTHGVSNRNTDSGVLVLENPFIYSRTSEGDTDYLDPVSLTEVRAGPQHLQVLPQSRPWSWKLGGSIICRVIWVHKALSDLLTT